MDRGSDILVAAGQDVSEAEWANLEAQAETLNGQLKDAPDDATVSSIVADFNTQVATVRATVAALNVAVCSAGGTTTTTGWGRIALDRQVERWREGS